MRTTRHSSFVLVGLLLLSLALLGCSSDDSPTEPQTGTVEIDLQADSFQPGNVLIAPGTTVRWVNRQATVHTITPDGHSEWTRVVLNEVGEVFEHTFDDEGTFPYFCEPHQAVGMSGQIRVQSP